ncbi:major facilitator superfamily domain-containing protein 6-like [Acanthaster planci]|uniref:Major facilitator superfamily domain-containing protein 6-like n=1 Tax=Acanthaster planci TaxID=133434 RepID=A0A8B7ZDM9_ACAPL|nr:major facilitator superfamily domain-containing protein 6-like [Acanthaster planci]
MERTSKETPFSAFRVNVSLIVYKVFYFSFWGATGSYLPYLSLYFKQLGFSPANVGIVSAFRPLSGFVLLPVIAAAADRFRCRRAILVTSILLGVVTAGALALLPHAAEAPCGVMEKQIEEFFHLNISLSGPDGQGGHSESFHASRVDNLLPSFPGARGLPGSNPYLHIPFEGALTNTSFLDVRNLPEKIRKTLIANQSWMYYQGDLHKLLVAVIVLATVMEVMMFSAICQGDIATLDALRREHGNADQYGWNRGFGTVGWGACSFGVGLILSSTRTAVVTCGFEHVATGYWTAFAAAGIVGSVAFFSTFYFGPYTYGEKKDDSDDTVSSSLGKSPIMAVVFSWHYGSVFVMIAFLGLCNGSMWAFLYWHLDNMGATQSFLGSLTAIQSLSDFVFGFLSAWTISVFGHIRLLGAGLFFFIIRFLYYSWIPAPWLVIFSETLHGLGSILTWITAVAYLNDAVPPQCRSTVQGILVAAYNGLGAGLGFFTSGLLVNRFGASQTFGLFAVSCTAFFVVFLSIQGLSKVPPSPWKDEHEEKQSPQKEVKDPDEEDALLDSRNK